MQKYTIRLAGFAAFGKEIRAFPVYGPTPCHYVYNETLATFPNTRAGYKQADAFVGSYPIERGEWVFDDNAIARAKVSRNAVVA